MPRRSSGIGAGGVVAAAVFTAVAVIVSSQLPDGGRSLDLLGYVLIVVAGAGLPGVRARPGAAFGVSVAAVGVYVARDYHLGPVLLTSLIALAALGLRGDLRRSAAAALGLCVVLGVAGVIAGSGVTLALFFVGWSGVVALIGEVVRRHQEQLESLRERTEVLERTREEELRRRIAEDRLSIARDLHDSVAHAIAVINVQAGAAAHVGQERPQAAADALVNIRRASGEALDELTAMLSILRESDAAPVRAPAPGLAQIFELVQDVRHDGLGVSMAAEGPLDRVAPSVGTAAFRIVQESVTNILRHAHAASAQISVIAGPSQLHSEFSADCLADITRSARSD